MSASGSGFCTIARATLEDCTILSRVLTTCGLSSSGLEDGGSYWMGLVQGEVAGAIGMERSGSAGLLRSLAVLPAYRGSGVGRALVEHLRLEARQVGVDELFLFSKDTGAFFQKFGWFGTDVRAVVARLSDAPQVSHNERVGWYDDERAFVRSTN